jgi:hypothetical protein
MSGENCQPFDTSIDASPKNPSIPNLKGGCMVGNWQKTMELLDRQGWECSYAKLVDLEGQKELYWVSITLGDKRLTCLWPTLEEAAINVNHFVAAAAEYSLE